jgi:hypothetical protein
LACSTRRRGTVATTIKAEPDLGDVYRAAPTTTPFGDAHGDHGRPVGVVEHAVHVVHTLTRTTHPRRSARRLDSPANPRLGLKAAAWTDDKPRPIQYTKFVTGECAYLGPLDDDEREALLGFWRTTKMLGRV